MKKIYIITILINILISTFCSAVFSQNRISEIIDQNNLHISQIVLENENPFNDLLIKLAPKITTELLKTEISESNNQRFIILPKIIEIKKEVTNSSPNLVVIELNLTITIGDGILGTKFGSVTYKLKGIGQSESLAQMNATAKIDLNSDKFLSFLNNSKNKIAAYYDSNCDLINSNALKLSSRGEFNNAISDLMNVPSACKDCYKKSINNLETIISKKMNFDCSKLLFKINTLISNQNFDEAYKILNETEPNYNCLDSLSILLKKIENSRCQKFLGLARGAWISKDIEKTSYFLSQISYNSDCNDSAIDLGIQVTQYLKEKENKEWKLVLKNFDQQFDIEKIKIKSSNELLKLSILNQPKIIYNLERIRNW